MYQPTSIAKKLDFPHKIKNLKKTTVGAASSILSKFQYNSWIIPNQTQVQIKRSSSKLLFAVNPLPFTCS